jgi:hypothetical protein
MRTRRTGFCRISQCVTIDWHALIVSDCNIYYCRAPSPEYVIYREPAKGKPEFMVLEVKLPGVVRAPTF